MTDQPDDTAAQWPEIPENASAGHLAALLSAAYGENTRLRQENADLLARLTKAGAVLDVARTAAEDIRIAFGDYDVQTD